MIRSDSHKEMKEYMENCLSIYTAFLFMGHVFWKENIEDRVKLLESYVLNHRLKITTADLDKIGGNDISENLAPKFPSDGGPCPSRAANNFLAGAGQIVWSNLFLFGHIPAIFGRTNIDYLLSL